MRLLVINNTAAGEGDTGIYDFVRAFVRDGDEVVMRVTDSHTRVEDLLADAGSFDEVVAAGGDGTVSSVMYELRGRGIPILAYPSGTSNLIVQNLDSPIEPYAFAHLARACETLDFDIGELEFGNRRVGFSMIAGAGYDAKIMESAKLMKESLGETAYLMAALGNANPTFTEFKLTLDGRRVEARGIAVLLINFGRIQFDISLAPTNDPRDGYFEVMVLKMSRTMQILPALIAAARARKERGKDVEIFLARDVTVECNPPITIQYDGEPTGITTPLHARCIRRAVRMVIDPTSERMREFGGMSGSSEDERSLGEE